MELKNKSYFGASAVSTQKSYLCLLVLYLTYEI